MIYNQDTLANKQAKTANEIGWKLNEGLQMEKKTLCLLKTSRNLQHFGNLFLKTLKFFLCDKPLKLAEGDVYPGIYCGNPLSPHLFVTCSLLTLTFIFIF